VILSFLLSIPTCAYAIGHTISSGGIGNVGARPERSRGNFENRISKTAGGVITTYLVDDVNPPEYAVRTRDTRPSLDFGESLGTLL
jgi:hypothetical protein